MVNDSIESGSLRDEPEPARAFRSPSVRSRLKPTYLSTTGRNVDITVAHIGAGLLGLPLTVQPGETIARVMEARHPRHPDEVRYPDVVIEVGRRAAKTTSVWSVILGRAATRENYRAVTTAQRGVVASRVLIEMAQAMIRNGTACESREWGHHPDLPALYRNSGRERLVWPNGNEVWAVPPDPGAVRSAAADDIVIDEAGELDVVRGQDFLDAVRPLQDTRGGLAQLIVAGTPPRGRQGPFWSLLEAGRNKAEPDLGIVDYCIADHEDAEDRAIWRRVHPGPTSGLTPMKRLEKEFRALGPIAFSREYLCRTAFDSTVRAIDATMWAEREVDHLVLPEHFGLGYDCAPDGSASAIAAAWRVDGEPHVALLEYRAGVSWVAREIRARRGKYRGVPIVADFISANCVAIADDLRRGRPSIDVEPPNFKRVQAASQTFVSRLPFHMAQPDLDRAVGGAVWREHEGGRSFGRRASGVDISPLVAGVMALLAYDSKPQRQRLSITSSAA